MAEPLTTELVAEMLGKLHVAFPRASNTQNAGKLADVYRNGLHGLSGDAVRAAVNRVIQEDEYFPKVARLREVSKAWMARGNAVLPFKRPSEDTYTCPICGAHATHRDLTYPKRDPKTLQMVRDEHGAFINETFASKSMDIVHDARAHGIYPREDA